MRLVEIVRGRATSPEVLATALALAKRLGKVGVVVRNAAGFVGNRMMFPYMYEAQFLAEEGATPERIDRLLTDWGMAMGIFAVDDMGGLDVAWRIRKELGQFEEPGARRPLVADKLVELGRLGQKAGRGWYRYGDDRKPIPDPEVVELIETVATGARDPRAATSPTPRSWSGRSTRSSTRARACSTRASPQRAADIDVIYLTGYGFPGYRGGPMFYADSVGLGVDPRARRGAPPRARRALGARAAPVAARRGRVQLPRPRQSTRSGRDGAHASGAVSEVRARTKPVRVESLETAVRRGEGGAWYLSSRQPLGPYPDTLSERLEHWAGRAPERVFLAERAASGAWRTLTYAAALASVRRLGQALVDRRLSQDRPLLILSGNGIDHALLALAAMYTGVLYAPVAPAYSLRTRDYAALREIVGARRAAARVRGGGGGVRAGAAGRAAGGHGAGRVVVGADGPRSHAVRRARGDTRDRRRGRRRGRACGRTASPRSCSPRARRGGRRVSSTPSACSRPTRR